MSARKILVCGGRDFDDAELVASTLKRYLDVDIVIHGGSRGADMLADAWARKRGVHTVTVCALWDVYGQEAGPIRNAVMLELGPDLVVAFRGGRGTANMCMLAEMAGVAVDRIGWP